MTSSPVNAADRREVEVALVGRPNAGKTSLLMHLSGTAQRPVNFPGTSVERAVGLRREGERVLRIVDLPGVSSLSGVTRDEKVAIDFVRDGEGSADVLCAVVDATKITVELALLRGLPALGKPVVVALNKLDVARAEGREVDPERLATELGLPVVVTDGLRAQGIEQLARTLIAAADAPPPAARRIDDVDAVGRRVQSVRDGTVSWTDRVDAVILNRWLGLPLLLLVMGAVFQLVFTLADPFMGWIEAGQGWLGEIIADAVPPGALQAFLVDGLVGGVGGVVIFVPQIALLVALVTVLEASGYMARAAFLLDRALRGVGLSGRSFLPMTTSFGCAVPGILATRIISDERDRLATIAVAPLMSCSARMPVYVLLIGAFFSPTYAGLVLLSLYAAGILTAALVAWVLRSTVLRGGTSMLMMELPSYQRPSLRVVWSQVRGAVREFAVLAGTIILATAVVIWFLSYYPRPAEVGAAFADERVAANALPGADERDAVLEAIDRREKSAYMEQSYLAMAGRTVQPVFAPAGFDWRTTVGILAAFPARELIVPTLGILYSVGDVDPGAYDLAELSADERPPDGFRQKLREAVGRDGRPSFDALTALALMVFFSLCSQCAATLATIRRETHSWRWPVFTFVYMTGLAWLAAVAVRQGGLWLGFGGGS